MDFILEIFIFSIMEKIDVTVSNAHILYTVLVILSFCVITEIWRSRRSENWNPCGLEYSLIGDLCLICPTERPQIVRHLGWQVIRIYWLSAEWNQIWWEETDLQSWPWPHQTRDLFWCKGKGQRVTEGFGACFVLITLLLDYQGSEQPHVQSLEI